MIEDSLRQYGAGRSILLDKNGRVIAGNKTLENAGAIGMEDVLVVQSDGTRLVAVQRTDLDLDDPHTRQLAIADNRSGQVSLDWDADALKGLVEDGVDLAPFWTADELASMWPQTVDLLTDEDDVPPVPVEPVSKLGDRPHSSPLHPTTKPVELIERAVLNSSNTGAIVLDLFGGSGSTLIACEKTGRRAYLMELDPKYCDVIVARYEQATGKKAVLSAG
jgi:sporulation protein YlmC with PRC-barrel domain